MSNKLPINRFLEYFSKPMSEDELVELNFINKVEPEIVELYLDFIVSLIDLVDATYLGGEIIKDKSVQTNHFNWCWEKTIHNFQLENIKFNQTGDHQMYFKKYITDVYYSNIEKSPDTVENMIDFWRRIMSINKIRTKSEYDIFQEVYNTLGRNFFRLHKT